MTAQRKAVRKVQLLADLWDIWRVAHSDELMAVHSADHWV